MLLCLADGEGLSIPEVPGSIPTVVGEDHFLLFLLKTDFVLKTCFV